MATWRLHGRYGHVDQDEIPIEGRLYRWDQINDALSRRDLRPAIERTIARAKADPEWAKAQGYTPQHIRAAILYLGGEFDGMSAEETNKAFLGSDYAPPASSQLAGRELVREVGKLQVDPTHRIAKERKAAGRELTGAQKSALEKMGRLENAMADEAQAEKPPLPGRYPTQRTYYSERLRAIAEMPVEQQIHAAREYRAELERHPGFLDEHHPEHKQILSEHHMTYKAEEYEGGGMVMPDETR